MGTRKLHRDWPEYELGSDKWSLPAPTDDLAYALEQAVHMTTSVPAERVDDTTLGQIDEVVRYAVSYHGSEWHPEHNNGSSELEMVVVARLTDGRWISVEANNDYTGWGCQDFAAVRVGTSEDDVVRNGLTEEQRRPLSDAERAS